MKVTLSVAPVKVTVPVSVMVLVMGLGLGLRSVTVKVTVPEAMVMLLPVAVSVKVKVAEMPLPTTPELLKRKVTLPGEEMTVSPNLTGKVMGKGAVSLAVPVMVRMPEAAV